MYLITILYYFIHSLSVTQFGEPLLSQQLQEEDFPLGSSLGKKNPGRKQDLVSACEISIGHCTSGSQTRSGEMSIFHGLLSSCGTTMQESHALWAGKKDPKFFILLPRCLTSLDLGGHFISMQSHIREHISSAVQKRVCKLLRRP